MMTASCWQSPEVVIPANQPLIDCEAPSYSYEAASVMAVDMTCAERVISCLQIYMVRGFLVSMFRLQIHQE